MIQRFATILNIDLDTLLKIGHILALLIKFTNSFFVSLVTPKTPKTKVGDKLISGKIVYHHASNKIRLTYFSILCKQILWINQIIKDNDIKGEYKVDKNKPCKLISLD